MKKSLLFFAAYWAMLLAVFVALKLLFMLAEPAYTLADMAMAPQVVAAGLTMDISVSAYLVSPLLLGLIAAQWVRWKGWRKLLTGYTWFVAVVVSVTAGVDAMLFPYWGFRLESTPIFYFTFSPRLALASVPWWQVVLGVLMTAALCTGVFLLVRLTFRLLREGRDGFTRRMQVVNTVVLGLVAAAMIIPIRGGVGECTMNPGRAYFCGDMNLNRAAQNPFFTLMYSLAHADRLGKEFNFYSDAEAREILRPVLARPEGADSSVIALKTPRPDIYLVVLESFSAHVMPSLGGENIAPCIDDEVRRGVSFTNFYAESFRTDRALATILSGYPSLPTTSVFKFTRKFENLPSLSRELAKAGYATTYYYGGDINFANQGGYLHAAGYDSLISETDFPASYNTGEWGVPDEFVFARALDDVRKGGAKPRFAVVQTSSSHEPFEVPFHRLADERANSIAYADSCLGVFMDGLRKSGRWDKSLVVITGDHYGTYPQGLTDPLARHHVPLIITGGAVEGAPATVATVGSQSGIAPTVLALLGLDSSAFVYGRNMLDARPGGQFAWMSEPDWYCLINDPEAEPVVVHVSGKADDGNPAVRRAKAFVQTVYDDLDAR